MGYASCLVLYEHLIQVWRICDRDWQADPRVLVFLARGRQHNDSTLVQMQIPYDLSRK